MRHQNWSKNDKAVSWFCYFQTCPVFYINKLSFIIKYKYCKQINKYLYCCELHLFSGLLLFWYQWYNWTSFYVCYAPGSNLYYINSKRHSKLDLNSHLIMNLLTFTSRYLVQFCNFYPQLCLATDSQHLNWCKSFA